MNLKMKMKMYNLDYFLIYLSNNFVIFIIYNYVFILK